MTARTPKPVIYLTSVAAVVAAKAGNARPDVARCVGPGQPHGIMRWPNRAHMPAWAFDRRALVFTPPKAYLARVRETGNLDGYLCALRELWLSDEWLDDIGSFSTRGLELYATDDWPRGRAWDGETVRHVGFVGEGDTLCCACGIKAARAGRCHRVLAAELLHLAGWRVVLDGIELNGARAAVPAQLGMEV